MHTSYYLRYLKRKQTVAPLPTTPEKCHCTTLWNAELFHVTEGNVAFHRALLKFGPCCNNTLPQLGLVLYTRFAAARLGCINLIFIEPGAKINRQYYRDMLLMQRLLQRSAALLEKCLSSSKTMRQHIMLVTQSSFCTVRHRSSSVLTSTRLITASGACCKSAYIIYRVPIRDTDNLRKHLVATWAGF